MTKCAICSNEIQGEHILTLVIKIDPELPSGKTTQYHYCRSCVPTIAALDEREAKN